jgi:hypothetical protein
VSQLRWRWFRTWFRKGKAGLGAPYGTERKVQESSIKSALLRLSAERMIPPRCTTGNIECPLGRCGREDAAHHRPTHCICSINSDKLFAFCIAVL